MKVRHLPSWIETDEDLELYHHGVKGQRWGVRHDRDNSSSSNSSNTGRKTTYTNRLTYTTGKSKGVKRRSKLEDSHSFNGGTSHYAAKYDPNMKKNRVKYRSGTSASGKNMTNIYAKDKESMEMFAAIMSAMYENQDPKVADQTIAILMKKYGELDFDYSKYDGMNIYSVFTNVSKQDQLTPAMAMIDQHSPHISTQNAGSNGMPSNVAEKAKDEELKDPQKSKQSTAPDISNGAPSNIKKTIWLRKKRRPEINTNPGTNGMPSNLNPILYKRKK